MENFLAKIEAEDEYSRERRNMNTEAEICLKCVLSSFTSTARVYGYTFFLPCSCYNRNDVNVHPIVTKFYSSFIECFYWINFVLVFSLTIPVLSEMIPCEPSYLLDKDDVIFMRMLIVNLTLTFALTFSIIKRVKLTTNIKLTKPEYFRRKELYDMINYTRIIFSVLLVTFIISSLLLNIFYFYPAVEEGKTYEHEALFCSVEIGLYINLSAGGILYLMYLLFLLAIILMNIFQKLSEDLQLLNMNHSNLETELELIMTQHNELWDYVKQMNGPFNYVLTILYSCLIALTSLLNYILIFSKMKFELRVLMCIHCAAMSFTCILVGFLVSAFTSAMQTSFQDIRRFAQCDLKLEQKLKIVNFMKRFGKASLYLSVNGFFNVTKKFPVKMSSALYSVFSNLLNLRTVSTKKYCSY
ncbi:uncharacterized protein LOC111621671 isoform X1 [Centruroides sculpturatus]|uniref:uncharacterized protein LOC111621671 isoform X1 n=1 Tax=Centruroides sculpturatus TaxID=218467 RepID=UPI000C6CA18C|nr:uncharacterized protein LOC111621671 isoform X1 [Centruroides sculpturatus]